MTSKTSRRQLHREPTATVDCLAQDAVPIDVSQLFAYNAIERCLRVGAIMGEKTRRLILRNAGDAANRHRKQYPRSATRPEVVVPVDNVKLTSTQRKKGRLTDPEYRSLNAPSTLLTGEQVERGETTRTTTGKRRHVSDSEQLRKKKTQRSIDDEYQFSSDDEEEEGEAAEVVVVDKESGNDSDIINIVDDDADNEDGEASIDGHRAELKEFMRKFKPFPEPSTLLTILQSCRELTLLYLQEQSYALTNVPTGDYPNADQRVGSGKTVAELRASIRSLSTALYRDFVHNVSVFAGEVASVKKTLRLFDHILEGRVLRVEWSSESLFHPRESSKGTDVHCRLSKCNKGLRVVRVTWSRDADSSNSNSNNNNNVLGSESTGSSSPTTGLPPAVDASITTATTRQENYILATHFSDLLYAFLVATNPLGFCRHFAHTRALLQGTDNARKVWELQRCGRTTKEFVARRDRTMDAMTVLKRYGEFEDQEQEQEQDKSGGDDDDDDDDTQRESNTEENGGAQEQGDDDDDEDSEATISSQKEDAEKENAETEADNTLLNPSKPFHRPKHTTAPRPLVWSPTMVLYLNEPVDVHWQTFSAQCPSAPLIAALPDRIISSVDCDAIAQSVVQAQRSAWIRLSEHITGLVKRKYPPAKTSVKVQ